MMRICPKCGDYYTDASLAFCLEDGTPLAAVERSSESWRKGSRVIEEKESALRRRARRLKWRRVLTSTVTMVLAAMIVCVVAANGFIYLNPQAEEPPPPEASTQAVAPGGVVEPFAPPATRRAASRPTPGPKPSPRLKPTPSPSPSPSPSPPPECTDEDKGRARETIVKKFGGEWRHRIEAERGEIVRQNSPGGTETLGLPSATASLGEIEYTATFSKSCATASITARYVWHLKINFNGIVKDKSFAGKKQFRCVKSGATTWLCR